MASPPAIPVQRQLPGYASRVIVLSEANEAKILHLIEQLGKRARGPGRIYLVGGSSIVLLGKGRQSTIDVDLKLDPEPRSQRKNRRRNRGQKNRRQAKP